MLGPVRTKVLSKDERARILLSMALRGVVGEVAVAKHVRLLLWPIVAHRRRLALCCEGGLRVE